MKLHANAALSWSGRRLLVERVLVQGWTLTAAAAAAGVSVRCVRKWVARYRLEGAHGLYDRCSAPRRVANRTAAERVAVIVSLRRLRMTGAEIAETLSMPLSTVSVVLRREGLGRLGLIGLAQPRRYERSRPGELVHVDVKKLGRIEGGAGKRVGGRAPGREGGDGSRLPQTSARLLPPPRDPGGANPHRQRRRLRLDDPCALLSRPRHQAPAHPAQTAADERQSRALHPHAPRRLGLRRHLPLEPRTHRRP